MMGSFPTSGANFDHLGVTAYNTFCQETENYTQTQPMPWSELPPFVRAAWIQVALVIISDVLYNK